MVKAKPVILRCPTCRKAMQHFVEILFTDNFTVIVNGVCCEAEITSGELDILPLMPYDSKDRGH